MESISSNTQNEFPDHLIDPVEKLDPKWMLENCQAYHHKYDKFGPAVFRNRAKEMSNWRLYAKGKQSIDKYKKRLGARDEGGKEMTSWRNQDWSILEIAPRFKRVVGSKVWDTADEMEVESVDPGSINAKRQYKASLEEFLLNQKFLEDLQGITGIEFPSPIQEGVPMPVNQEDIDVHMNMYYKDRYAMEMTDLMDRYLDKNNWQRLAKEVIEDLTEVGQAGCKVWIDQELNLRLRRCVPERVGVWGYSQKDYRDAKAVWEYVDLSLNEFVEESQGLSRKEAEKLFKEASAFTDYSYVGYNNNVQEYYNFEKRDDRCTYMDLRFFSLDTWVYQKSVNKFGNQRIVRKPLSWYDPSKTYDNGNEVIVRKIMNVYECKWLVGTEYVWDFKLANNMPRDLKNLSMTKLGYSLFNTDNTSFVSQMIPVFDSIQINWLQYQNHILKSKPQGVEIEMSAFEDINMGKGFEKMNPRQIFQMYYDTGNIVWRRKDWSGRDVGWKPISESSAILPDGAFQHLQIILQLIDYLRAISGLNEITDSSTPNPEIGKAVSELAVQSSNNALDYLNDAYENIYMNVCRTMLDLIPQIVQKGGDEGMVPTIGLNSFLFLKNNTDIPARHFGIRIKHRTTDEERARLTGYVQLAIKNGEIGADDGYMIETEDNLYRAANLLMIKRREHFQLQQQMKKDETEMLAQQQTMSAQQAAQAQAEAEQAKWGFDMQKEQFLSQLRVTEDRDKIRNEILLERVKQGHELSLQEKDLLNKLIISREDNESDVEQTLILAAAQKEMARSYNKGQNGSSGKQPKSKQASNR